MPYRTLSPEKIVATIEQLERRIGERFPGRGLNKVCDELLQVARASAGRVKKLSAPAYLLRALTGLVLIAGLGVIVYAFYRYVSTPPVEAEAFEFFQGIEAILNIVILMGAGSWFLLTLETRTKQERILADLHELRALAHVVDMHQLTKDPMVVTGRGPSTASSPERNMSAFELGRYLDYCSEMLSLTAKIAALYMATTRDHVVIQAVNEIQDLTTSLSAKIFHKISLIDAQGNGTRLPAAAIDDETGEDVINRACSPLHPFAIGD